MDNVFDFVSVNLEIKAKKDLEFPYLDHGFLYGYGLFESIRIQQGWPVLIREHLSRLRRGSIILDIPFLLDQDAVLKAILQLIEKNNISDGVLNLYLTAGDRSLDPSRLKESPEPVLFMVPRHLPEATSSDGIVLSVRQESFQRTPLDRVKTMSWMKNVLERKLHTEGDDVLLYNDEHSVLETCTANAFFVSGRRLITPESSVILAGITRQFILNHQDELGFEVCHQDVMLQDLNDFDEIFLTNALKGIIPVKQTLDYTHLSSGSITSEVQTRYRELISERVHQSLAHT